MVTIRARSKITLHFKRRCIPSGCVPKAQQYLDIPNLSRLASQAPQHLKLLIYFWANPNKKRKKSNYSGSKFHMKILPCCRYNRELWTVNLATWVTKKTHKISVYGIMVKSVHYLYTKLCKDINMFLKYSYYVSNYRT